MANKTLLPKKKNNFAQLLPHLINERNPTMTTYSEQTVKCRLCNHSQTVYLLGSRKILYLDSTQAVKIDPYLAEFYHRLIVNGKSPKTAKCACMRKMLTILRAMVAANRRYTPELFTKKLQCRPIIL